MKYLGKPAGMWALFAGSFEKHLTVEFDLTAEQAKDVAARAKKKYREIIAKLPEFDKRDRFEMNIVNCAMLAAFILCMPQRPDIKTLTDYYAAAMMTPKPLSMAAEANCSAAAGVRWAEMMCTS